MRRSIFFLLISTVVTLLVLFVSGGLWGLLAATGDQAGALVSRGIALVAAVFGGLCFIGLVILLAAAYLQESDERRTTSRDSRAENRDPE